MNNHLENSSENTLYSRFLSAAAPFSTLPDVLKKGNLAQKYTVKQVFLVGAVIVGFAVLLELVIRFAQLYFLSLQQKIWTPRQIPFQRAMEKMLKNAEKALVEHRENSHSCFASLAEGLPSLEKVMSTQPRTPLLFEYAECDTRGKRDHMEDVHFYKEIPQGVITGVLDGHGGDEVAIYASAKFQEKFPNALTQKEGNVHQAFEAVIYDIQTSLEAKHAGEKEGPGSAAVFCFIDKHTNLIYTATLGDCEANIYRKTQFGHLKSIPLSCVRDWSSKKDALRAAIYLNNPALAKEWPTRQDSKNLRVKGLNVSRAFGDSEIRGTINKPGVISKPKLTVNLLQPGDILLLASDGLKDYITEQAILYQITRNQPNKSIAQRLIDYTTAYHENSVDLDNVTVISITCS